MWTIDEYQQYFNQQLEPEVVYAARLLESRGQFLGLGYGTSSAIRKATALILREIEEDEKYGHGI